VSDKVAFSALTLRPLCAPPADPCYFMINHRPFAGTAPLTELPKGAAGSHAQRCGRARVRLSALALCSCKTLENAWKHSTQIMDCKSAQLSSSTPLVLIYETEQDLNEERRCVRNGVFILSLANQQTFNGFLLFASMGLDVESARTKFRFGTTA
jgi:hypothetical protein